VDCAETPQDCVLVVSDSMSYDECVGWLGTRDWDIASLMLDAFLASFNAAKDAGLTLQELFGVGGKAAVECGSVIVKLPVRQQHKAAFSAVFTPAGGDTPPPVVVGGEEFGFVDNTLGRPDPPSEHDDRTTGIIIGCVIGGVVLVVIIVVVAVVVRNKDTKKTTSRPAGNVSAAHEQRGAEAAPPARSQAYAPSQPNPEAAAEERQGVPPPAQRAPDVIERAKTEGAISGTQGQGI
jgi:hypothetical protein